MYLAPSIPPLMSSSSSSFFNHGWSIIPNCLDTDTISSFTSELSDQLAAGIHADSGCASPVHLADPQTWPQGRARRVMECVPRGDLPHWDALASSPALCRALDELVGVGAWELPRNAVGEGGKLEGPRHFYAPVAFPEASAAEQGAAAGRGSLPCPGPRRALFMSCVEEAAGAGGVPTAREAACRWHPVSRRRFLNKGWHLDQGPGFPGDGARGLEGDPRQCVVVLLLLSDWAPGGGGTAVVPGSHLWVLRDIARAAAAGGPPPTHEALNLACVRRMRAQTEAGRVLLACACGAEEHAAAAVTASAGARLPNDIEGNGPLLVQQLCGKAGDVVLMHPLLLHSGTTNLRESARLMINGMVVARSSPCAILKHTLRLLG